MREILQNWIQARLGIMIDLAPEIFGYYTKDGKLLAEILHSYDIINRDQLNTLLDTHDPALCRVNLKHLRSWLRFLGIDCSKENMEEISCGKGTTSLRLFYKVYLCLESKDRLHFVTLQKEREKFVPDSKKFEVTKVSEDPPPYVTPDHPLSKKLVEGKDTIEWHRSKFPTLLRRFEQVKDKLRDCRTYTINVESAEELYDAEKPKSVSRRDAEIAEIEESEELDRFARKYRPKKKTLEEQEEGTQVVSEDPEMAKAYVDWLKFQSKRTATMDVLKKKMQNSLLAELWERVAEEHEEAFDKAIAGRVLDQSKYEKQIVTKLCEVREQKSIMADNQKLVDGMTLQTNETEYLASLEREKDLTSKARKDVDVECKRMCELMRRLRDKKIEMIREKHWNLCYETVLDLLDLAMQMASYRKRNNEDAPSLILREWQALFLRCQPIFDEYANLDMDTNLDEEDKKDLLEEAAGVNLEKIEELQDALFVDYLELNTPWNEYTPPIVEDAQESFELGHMVVGYVAHRLLNYLRTDPAEKARAFSEKFHRAAIILGFVSPAARETIKALLEKNLIQLVRMEDAINYCLQRYKEEMSEGEFIDLAAITASDETVEELRKRSRSLKSSQALLKKRTVTGRGSARRHKAAKESKKKIEKSAKKPEKLETTDDKETQTPRNIPYDDLDPVLTDSAYIGKWAYEYLTIGEPITNELAVKILTEYLKSLSVATGWALMDYPTTYEQLALLEETLTGNKFPPNPDFPDFEDITIEDVESLTPRIAYEEIVDPSTLYRESRIVPDPFKQTEKVPTNRFVNVFVRLVQKPKTFNAGERLYETLQSETPAVDKFYSSQNVAYLLYYSSLDLTTLKVLARLVIGEPLQSRPSEELFGSILDVDHAAERSVGSKAPIVRRLLTAEPSEENSEGEEEEEEQDFDRYVFSAELPIEMELRLIRPGEKDWEWIKYPLPSTLAVYLSNLWSGLEKAYVSGLKEVLLLKSVHMAGIDTYKNFLTKAATEYIARPHNNQDLLHAFHKAFNKVDHDARNDIDVKCELHRQLADLQTQLWEVCDRRRDEVERERRRFVEYQWTVFQGSILYNFYASIIQIEMDRCIDTVRMLHDYYLGMLKRPLLDTQYTKIVLNRMIDPGVTPGDVKPCDVLNPTAKRESTADQSRPRTGSLKSAASSPPNVAPLAPEYDVLRKEICDLLIDRSKSSEDTESVCILKTIAENVRYAKHIVDRIAARASEILAREEVAASKNRDYAIDLPDSNDPQRLLSRLQDLFLEWRYAIGYELARVRSRLDSFIAASRSDVFFLLDTMQRTYHKIYDLNIERYWREMKSVNEMANVFCLAIEEARPLEKEMLLDGDRFIVRSNVFIMSAYWNEQAELKEVDSDTRFRVVQVSRLIEIFKRVAPHGTIAERAFVYILHDLASQGMEEGESLSLPCCWYRLRPQDITDLVRDLFQSADYVDWREFLIYALELPTPTTQELLIARDRFRIQDPELTEVISRSQFLRTPLWFCESVEMSLDTHKFLYDDFHRNNEDLYEEELYQLEPDEKNGIMKIGNSISSLLSSSQSSEKLRLILAKELLCRTYMINRNKVNYTAMLLAFCKDENPQEGFGKALALALGSRVCTDYDEGENYIEEFYKQTQMAKEEQFLQENFKSETIEAAKEIIGNLMDRVDESIVEIIAENSGETQPRDTRSTSKNSMYSSESQREKTSTFISSTGEEECDDSPKDQEFIIYWLPLNVCLTVLTAALSCYTMKPDLFGQKSNLRENLTTIYRELRDDTLNCEKNVVLVHRLLNHDFMKQILSSTSKFIEKRISSMIKDILRPTEGRRFA